MVSIKKEKRQMTMNIKEGFMDYINYLIRTHQHITAENLAKWYVLAQKLSKSENKGNNLLSDAYNTAIIRILKSKDEDYNKTFDIYRRLY